MKHLHGCVFSAGVALNVKWRSCLCPSPDAPHRDVTAQVTSQETTPPTEGNRQKEKKNTHKGTTPQHTLSHTHTLTVSQRGLATVHGRIR